MIYITDIRKGKRGYYALFSEEGFLFSVDEDTLFTHELQIGSMLSEENLSALKQTSDTQKCKDHALRFLARRPYATQELYRKLCQTHDEFSAQAAVEALEEGQLLDDAQFAKELTEALSQKGKSARAIYYALLEKGVECSLAEEARTQQKQHDIELAVKILQKSYIDKLRQGKKQAVMAALSRRGFAHEDIQEALCCIQDEWEEQDIQ